MLEGRSGDPDNEEHDHPCDSNNTKREEDEPSSASTGTTVGTESTTLLVHDIVIGVELAIGFSNRLFVGFQGC